MHLGGLLLSLRRSFGRLNALLARLTYNDDNALRVGQRVLLGGDVLRQAPPAARLQHLATLHGCHDALDVGLHAVGQLDARLRLAHRLHEGPEIRQGLVVRDRELVPADELTALANEGGRKGVHHRLEVVPGLLQVLVRPPEALDRTDHQQPLAVERVAAHVQREVDARTGLGVRRVELRRVLRGQVTQDGVGLTQSKPVRFLQHRDLVEGVLLDELGLHVRAAHEVAVLQLGGPRVLAQEQGAHAVGGRRHTMDLALRGGRLRLILRIGAPHVWKSLSQRGGREGAGQLDQ
mmetsp:Transcript_30188/g.76675  ORF Transcript_30188/g.76675 Transcript_30188/m.76675 type:complete len:292 (-) Transcript_30188:20-895(-)